ncbi:hypothetical protein VPH35_053346 [Triticum aestivum]|uniref:Uncharacterized protein n=1 Tax=Triticum turgidum subsp. durum TaxID=4567 RepID=A0A9R1QN10_TRITD|nr:unnamed protein product [Triticum turgidum subsp. durum]
MVKEAVHRMLAEVARRHGAGRKVVVVTTFSTAHFEGDCDKAGACLKAVAANAGVGPLRFAVLDVTKLVNQYPDGHPGLHMRSDPFVGGTDSLSRVQNDCVH